MRLRSAGGAKRYAGGYDTSVVAVVTVLLVLVVSLLVTRIATMALVVTGMSRESARFQARSALTGTGFTTGESESVVNHPVRRRIVMLLMLAGGAGVVTAIASLFISFTGTSGRQTLVRAGIILAGLVVVLFLARSRAVDRLLERVIGRLLARYTDLDVRDYAALLHVAEDFAVVELAVAPGAWIAGSTLGELDLRAEGVVVLGITRADGRFIGAPIRETPVRTGDTLVLYGGRAHVAELGRRQRGAGGDEAHRAAVARQLERVAAERGRDAREHASAR